MKRLVSVAAFLVIGASLAAQDVSFDRIMRPEKEPQNWLSYSGTVFNQRFSPLTQVTPANVKNLELQWIWQARSLEKFEATALAVDGVLYTVQGPPTGGVYQVVALDGVTGRPYWTTEYRPGADAGPCCGRVSRGLAILGDTLYLGTIDAHLLAIDAKTGRILWNVEAARAIDKYSITHAPLVLKDKIIVGVAGGDRGIRAFIAAYDAGNGKELWRFYTIPGPGEPGQRQLVRRIMEDRWRCGVEQRRVRRGREPRVLRYRQPVARSRWQRPGRRQPVQRQRGRARSRFGKLKWHYQFTPHDMMDYDSTQVPILADMQWQGRRAR
jgi:alcohol dehydrogenase (cytochrome c)